MDSGLMIAGAGGLVGGYVLSKLMGTHIPANIAAAVKHITAWQPDYTEWLDFQPLFSFRHGDGIEGGMYSLNMNFALGENAVGPLAMATNNPHALLKVWFESAVCAFSFAPLQGTKVNLYFDDALWLQLREVPQTVRQSV
jgi:hypothetical protein